MYVRDTTDEVDVASTDSLTALAEGSVCPQVQEDLALTDSLSPSVPGSRGVCPRDLGRSWR